MAAQLKRGVVKRRRYAEGDSDVPAPAPVQYPASGLKPDLSNAVMRGGFLTAPGDENATIAARQQGYAAKAQADPAWAQQWGINPQTGISNDERYLDAKVAAAAAAGTVSAPSSVLTDFAQTQGAPGGAIQADRYWSTIHPSPAVAAPQPPIGGGTTAIIDGRTGQPIRTYNTQAPQLPNVLGAGTTEQQPGGVTAIIDGRTGQPISTYNTQPPQTPHWLDRTGINMTPLRRGIAHYQVGEENVPAPSGAGQLWRGIGNALNPWSDPGAAGQRFIEAAQNPESSPFTSAVAGALSNQATMKRAADLVAPPSPLQYMLHLFGGTRASMDALNKQADTAAKLGDPLVQQHLVNTPEHLAIAERDPHGFAEHAQNPGFRQLMGQAVDAHAATEGNSKIATPEERRAAVAAGMSAGTNPNAAHAMQNTNYYTHDQFMKATEGMPTKAFLALYGAQMGHVVDPKEKAATELFDRLHGDLAKADLAVKKMEDEDALQKKHGLAPLHNRYVLWGQNAYDKAKEEREKALQASMNALKSFTGISTKITQ